MNDRYKNKLKNQDQILESTNERLRVMCNSQIPEQKIASKSTEDQGLSTLDNRSSGSTFEDNMEASVESQIIEDSNKLNSGEQTETENIISDESEGTNSDHIVSGTSSVERIERRKRELVIDKLDDSPIRLMKKNTLITTC